MHKIAIVDDNTLLRENIFKRLDEYFQIIFNTGSALELLAFLEYCEADMKPTLILMDIEMDEMDGIAATTRVKEMYPEIKVVMLTVFEQDEKVWQSILAGADGYILKDEPKERLVLHIHDVLQGGSYMSPAIARKAMNLYKQSASLDHKKSKDNALLSNREVEILELISKGYSHKQMAAELFISPATAKTHINNIYKKLRVNNKIEAMNKFMGAKSG
jgi:DNA-binding NarL/FixJ family response regulator